MKRVNSLEKHIFKDLLKNLPKTEIHLHLEGLISIETIWTLINKNQIQIDNVKSKKDVQRLFNINSLDEFISLYINVIQNVFRYDEDIEYLIEDAKNYLERNNVVYAEIFFAPTKFVQNGMSYKNMIDILHTGAERIKKTHNIEIKFIIDVSRTYGTENAQKNLDLTLKYLKPSIIGIGLGGAESKGPAKDFNEVFKNAVEKGLHVVAHAGEDIGPESIWDALNFLGAQRIGHGISAIQDEELMAYLKKHQIPLEVCPTSNLFTKKYVQNLKEHPIRPFFSKGLNVTLNTDDPTLFSIELIDEYMNLLTDDFFTQEELVQLVKNNITSSFLPQFRKQELVEQVDIIINKYLS